MESNKFMEAYADEKPYPPVKVCGQNRMYASAMLTNMASCNSELSAVTLYFYNSLVTRGAWKRASDCFHGISIVEMHHLDIFGQLALLLGADPRYCSRCHNRMMYWNAGCNKYTMDLSSLINNAIAGENKAIEQYFQQIRWIQDPCIVELLKRIIMDEERHIAIFHQLAEDLNCGKLGQN